MRAMTLLVMLLILASCGGSGGGGSDSGQREQETTTGGTTDGNTTGSSGGSKIDLTYDSALSTQELTSIKKSMNVLESLKISGSKVEGFSEVFGGNSTSNVIRYLNQRVNYIFSQNTEYDSRLVLNAFQSPNGFSFYAKNPSSYIWYTSVINEPRDVKIIINNQPIDISSSRIGVVNLGDIFVESDAITQAITIVHEARHSDCPNGAKASEIQRWFNGLGPIDRTCGQLHGFCAEGGSCDLLPWGPYAIDFIYSKAIADACTNCSELQKQQGQVNANFVQEAAYDIQGTLDGKYGNPNMGNSKTVRDDL